MAPHQSPAMPPLAPSVEEAYRRKCIQLKQRTREVEEANDAARLRLDRIKRQVEKLRLERAFLLEQLSRRTSTNVEDSEGSPSPPPAPEEKPLRSKRGHRKPSIITDPDKPASSSILNNPNFSFSEKNPVTGSPAPSESFAGHGIDPKANGADTGTTTNNGTPAPGATAASISLRPPRRPNTAFELYCADARPLVAKPAAVTSGGGTTPGATPPNSGAAGEKSSGSAGSGAGKPPRSATPSNVDEELARGWKGLSDDARDEYKARHAREMEQYQKDSEEYAAANAKESSSRDDERKSGDDDDVEMGNDEYGGADD